MRPGQLVFELSRALGRWRFLARARVAALRAHATLELDVDPTASFAPGARVVVGHRTSNTLRVGAHRGVGAVTFELLGGTIELAEGGAVRDGCRLRSKGLLRVGARTIVSWGCIFNTTEHIEIGADGGVADYCTLADAHHIGDEGHALTGVAASPVRLGDRVFLGMKATVTGGVSLGDDTVVAAGAVVTRSFPAGSRIGGVPARPLGGAAT